MDTPILVRARVLSRATATAKELKNSYGSEVTGSVSREWWRLVALVGCLGDDEWYNTVHRFQTFWVAGKVAESKAILSTLIAKLEAANHHIFDWKGSDKE